MVGRSLHRLIADKGVVGVMERHERTRPLWRYPTNPSPTTSGTTLMAKNSPQKPTTSTACSMSKATYEGSKIPTPTAPLLSPAPPTHAYGQRHACLDWWQHRLLEPPLDRQCHDAAPQPQRLLLRRFWHRWVSSIHPPRTPYVKMDSTGPLPPLFPHPQLWWPRWPGARSFGRGGTNIVTQFTQLRYRFLLTSTVLLPVHLRGHSHAPPLYACDTDDMHTHHCADEVMHGDHILYCPMLEEGLTSRSLLPKGNWYHYFYSMK